MPSELPILTVDAEDDPAQSFSQAPATGIGPEAELLLCCARTRMDLERAERIKALLQQPIDWVYLIRTALPHGMLPLLYWNLDATCPEAVPKATLDPLRYNFHANERRNLFLTQELLKLLELLKTHEIPAIPFKGPVLAASVYGNLALRQFEDLDILVRRQDVLRAKDLLLSDGYRLRKPRIPLTDAEEAAFLRRRCEFCLVREEGRVVVDLHWGITYRSFPFPLGFEDLQERLVPVDLAGTTVPSLAPEDLLLILCVHGSKHLWIRLEWICGVAELIRARPEMDWGRAIDQAQRLGSGRMLSLGLLLAKDLLGTVLPEGVREQMQADPVVKSLATKVRERLFCDADSPPQEIESWRFRYSVRERWRDRWPCFLNLMRSYFHFMRAIMAPTARDRTFLPLPPSLSFLCYLIRPIRLVGKYVLGPLGRSFIGKTNAKRAKASGA